MYNNEIKYATVLIIEIENDFSIHFQRQYFLYNINNKINPANMQNSFDHPNCSSENT